MTNFFERLRMFMRKRHPKVGKMIGTLIYDTEKSTPIAFWFVGGDSEGAGRKILLFRTKNGRYFTLDNLLRQIETIEKAEAKIHFIRFSDNQLCTGEVAFPGEEIGAISDA